MIGDLTNTHWAMILGSIAMLIILVGGMINIWEKYGYPWVTLKPVKEEIPPALRFVPRYRDPTRGMLMAYKDLGIEVESFSITLSNNITPPIKKTEPCEVKVSRYPVNIFGSLPQKPKPLNRIGYPQCRECFSEISNANWLKGDSLCCNAGTDFIRYKDLHPDERPDWYEESEEESVDEDDDEEQPKFGIDFGDDDEPPF